ncbi:MAG: hypothetical protein HQ567_25360 [Candidatus Nealsonbacteria bacterium]|nr:hypothetical protein [Candidatus Nealsonbacteria bacterium]
MHELLALLAMGAFIGTFVGMIAIGAWILLPVDRAAKDRRAAVQFTLLDFLCLFVVVQLPTGIIRSIGSNYNERWIWLMYAFAWIACGLMWWISVRRLSLAGVHRPWHRAVFQAAVLPVAYFGVIAGVALVVRFA